jgi:hypothetical protein
MFWSNISRLSQTYFECNTLRGLKDRGRKKYKDNFGGSVDLIFVTRIFPYLSKIIYLFTKIFFL